MLSTPRSRSMTFWSLRIYRYTSTPWPCRRLPAALRQQHAAPLPPRAAGPMTVAADATPCPLYPATTYYLTAFLSPPYRAHTFTGRFPMVLCWRVMTLPQTQHTCRMDLPAAPSSRTPRPPAATLFLPSSLSLPYTAAPPSVLPYYHPSLPHVPAAGCPAYRPAGHSTTPAWFFVTIPLVALYGGTARAGGTSPPLSHRGALGAGRVRARRKAPALTPVPNTRYTPAPPHLFERRACGPWYHDVRACRKVRSPQNGLLLRTPRFMPVAVPSSLWTGAVSSTVSWCRRFDTGMQHLPRASPSRDSCLAPHTTHTRAGVARAYHLRVRTGAVEPFGGHRASARMFGRSCAGTGSSIPSQHYRAAPERHDRPCLGAVTWDRQKTTPPWCLSYHGSLLHACAPRHTAAVWPAYLALHAFCTPATPALLT